MSLLSKTIPSTWCCFSRRSASSYVLVSMRTRLTNKADSIKPHPQEQGGLICQSSTFDTLVHERSLSEGIGLPQPRYLPVDRYDLVNMQIPISEGSTLEGTYAMLREVQKGCKAKSLPIHIITSEEIDFAYI